MKRLPLVAVAALVLSGCGDTVINVVGPTLSPSVDPSALASEAAGLTQARQVAACKAEVAAIDIAAEAYVASHGSGQTSNIIVTSLAPTYLATVPAKIGTLTITSTTTVADVNAVAC